VYLAAVEIGTLPSWRLVEGKFKTFLFSAVGVGKGMVGGSVHIWHTWSTLFASVEIGTLPPWRLVKAL
jgi:hypothetical protein